jgi:hypothetical protein
LALASVLAPIHTLHTFGSTTLPVVLGVGLAGPDCVVLGRGVLVRVLVERTVGFPAGVRRVRFLVSVARVGAIAVSVTVVVAIAVAGTVTVAVVVVVTGTVAVVVAVVVAHLAR